MYNGRNGRIVTKIDLRIPPWFVAVSPSSGSGGEIIVSPDYQGENVQVLDQNGRFSTGDSPRRLVFFNVPLGALVVCAAREMAFVRAISACICALATGEYRNTYHTIKQEHFGHQSRTRKFTCGTCFRLFISFVVITI